MGILHTTLAKEVAEPNKKGPGGKPIENAWVVLTGPDLDQELNEREGQTA